MLDIQELIEQAIDASGADGCVVIGSEHTETNLRWAANSLTTNGQMSSRSITVVSTVDGPGGTAAGVVTRTVTTTDQLLALVRDSEQAARRAGPADDVAPLVNPYEHGDDWNSAPATTGAEVFVEFAPALGAAFRQAAGRDERLFGFAEHQLTSTFVASSTGLRRRFDQPDGRVEINGKSADLVRSAWVGVHTRDFTDVDVAALTGTLHQRLEWARTRIDLPAGRYETILPPCAVADLMLDAYVSASARDAQEGRSVFALPVSEGASDAGGEAGLGNTRLGERLATLNLNLRSDPAEPGMQCAPFEVVTASDGSLRSVFDNGSPVTAASWITDGRLAELLRTRNWAARTGTQPRPFVDNLIMDGGGTAGLDELIANTARGLLLTCLWYIRVVDPQTLLLTGLTRDGVYLIENGKVIGAVNNFRFNESPIDLLGRITEVGRTEPTLPREWGDYFSRVAMPAVRVPDFNMSTVSRAS